MQPWFTSTRDFLGTVFMLIREIFLRVDSQDGRKEVNRGTGAVNVISSKMANSWMDLHKGLALSYCYR